MENFLTRLSRLLRQHFPGATAEFEPFVPKPHVGGFLVWDGFERVESRERVKRVWDVLRKELKEEDVKKVALILPVTSTEMAVRREELAREEAERKRPPATLKTS